MARPKAAFPAPHTRNRGSSWQVYWTAAGSFYGLGLGAASAHDAETARMQVALALRTGEWPEWAWNAPAVRRYLGLPTATPDTGPAGQADAGAPTTPGPVPSARPSAFRPSGLLAEYERSLRSEVSASWAGTSLAHLRELAEVSGRSLASVTARDAQEFLDSIVRTAGPFLKGKGQRSVATRNRALAACRRFYGWAVRTGRIAANPFDGAKALRESAPAEIVHLAPKERNAVLRAANRLPGGVAVWLTLWTGLRRGEVARVEWRDVSMERGRLTVRKAKTARPRVVPLAKPVWSRLRLVRPTGASGRIVPWPAAEAEWRWAARGMLEALRSACPDIPRERIRWNAFRHTFGSLLAQAGVSLDKISAWMGNSPGICRRHYAEFVPRDRRDVEIDRL